MCIIDDYTIPSSFSKRVAQFGNFVVLVSLFSATMVHAIVTFIVTKPSTDCYVYWLWAGMGLFMFLEYFALAWILVVPKPNKTAYVCGIFIYAIQCIIYIVWCFNIMYRGNDCPKLSLNLFKWSFICLCGGTGVNLCVKIHLWVYDICCVEEQVHPLPV